MARIEGSNSDLHSQPIIQSFPERKTIGIFDPYDHIILVMGRKRSGKSHCARKIAATYNRKIIYDFNWEHEGDRYKFWANYDHPIICRDLKELRGAYWEAKNRSWYCLIYQPPDKEKTTFNAFCDFINKNVVYCCIYVEELQSLTTATSIPKAFKDLEANGRHRKCGLLLTFRGVKNIPTLLFDDCDYIFMFKQRRKATYEYMKEYAEESKVDTLAEAPDYYYIMVDASENTVLMKPLPDLTPKDI